MAIDEINSTKSVPSTITQTRDRAIDPPVTPSPAKVTNAVPGPVSGSQGATPAQEANLLINESLRTVNFEPPTSAGALLRNETNPQLTELVRNQNLSSAQQSGLAVNKTLQALSFDSSTAVGPLLINETKPTTTVFLENQNLSPVQRAALSVNDTLQSLATSVTETGNTVSAAGTGGAQNLNQGQPNTLLATGTVAGGVAAGAQVQGSTLAASAAGVQTTVPGEITNPNLTTALPITDRNIIATPVYEVRDPKPPPAEPKSRKRVVFPPMPVGRVRPVDRLVLKREWEARKDNRQKGEALQRPPLEERSLREMISRTNDDLVANGLPIRLVLAKDSEGAYSLDIYDCSDDTACQLSKEVPLNLNDLLTILDNIEHESGIIVNVMT